jgi:hypothetical protein
LLERNLAGEKVVTEKLAGEELGRSARRRFAGEELLMLVRACVREKRYEVSEIWRKKRERGGEIRTKRGWILIRLKRIYNF